ncbi:HTH domain-containing protein [Lentilactobacillus hilgardii]|uniref:HTH domain-containing protein n=1 Tax=Lentilactobacillus hilgardii TaxID=1588 RepID=UPI0021C2C354|nr:HTH domain-containing protein [Lentilactobacillus hilgardii]MCP9333210.1 HTH domain-containing protein [Lentilactobacillus hilgardii]MCP9349857.1 HTH domain-containing protein [Lentilactobacillus hilgardii]MCP9352747.1 HTH domain-containing protein [Lentilactobacillus hilgardii]
MRKLTKTDIQVLRLLKKGADNKVTKRQLMDKAKITARNLYDAIETLRSLGIPIMASRNVKDPGYYIAQTEDEKINGIAQYKKQIATERHNLMLLEKANIDSYLNEAIKNPDFLRLYGQDLIEVTHITDHSATIKIKDTL